MSNKKILVIEDDADVRLGYNVLLKANNYDTCLAGDGVYAISETLKQRPDLIILDLGLPAGDGYVVLKRLKANPNFAVIPVIVVSGRDPHTNRELALKAGASAYLQKPWDDFDLLATIREELTHSGPPELQSIH